VWTLRRHWRRLEKVRRAQVLWHCKTPGQLDPAHRTGASLVFDFTSD
jgi:hypothetical protein